MGVPNKFPFKPLAAYALITELNPYLIDMPFDLFDAPFAKSNALPTPFHTSYVLVHGIENRGKSDGRMVLYKGQGFSLLRRSRWGRRRQRHPCIVESAEQQDGHNGITDDVGAQRS